MLTVGVLCGITCLAMMMSIVWKPQITIRGIGFDTYPIVAILGCLAVLLSGSLPLGVFFDGLTASSAVNPIKILLLFLSMTFLSVYLDEAGFFHYLAGLTLRRAGGSQTKLLRTLYVTVAVLTVFTSNDIVVLTFTPFIAYFSRAAGIQPIPYLVAEFVAANTFSMVFIIGNPTNIYLATGSGIGFAEYCKVMFLPTLAAGIVAYAVIRMLFRKELKKVISTEVEPSKIKHRTAVTLGLIHLSVATVLLILSSYVSLPMWLIAVCAAGSLLLTTVIANAVQHRGPRLLFRSIQRLPWLLIPFVISMFALVLAMKHCGISAELAKILNHGNPVWTYGITSALVSNLINNIPMSVLFESLLSYSAAPIAVYAAVIGSNLGAYLTPIGALAGILWMSILKRMGIAFGFARFLSYGLRIGIAALLAALSGLMLSAYLFL